MVRNEKVVIVDDDNQFSELLKIKLKKYFSNKIVIFKNVNYEYLEREQIKVLFLDVELSGTNAFEIVEELEYRGISLPIVFISYNKEYVFDVMQKDHVFFIKKNDLDADLKKTMNRLHTLQIDKEVVEIKGNSIRVKDIIYISAHNHHVRFCMTRGLKYEIRISMKRVENALSEFKFMRIHNSYIINPTFIKRFSNETVIMLGGKEITVSRTFGKKAINNLRR